MGGFILVERHIRSNIPDNVICVFLFCVQPKTRSYEAGPWLILSPKRLDKKRIKLSVRRVVYPLQNRGYCHLI